MDVQHMCQILLTRRKYNADSVLKDLQKALAPRVSEVKSLWTTFDNYCVEDSSQQRCESQLATNMKFAMVIKYTFRLGQQQFQKLRKESTS